MSRFLPIAGLALLGVLSRGAPQIDMKSLLADLRSQDPRTKLGAMKAAAEWGPRAEAAVPDLVAAQQDRSETTRLYAALALGKIGKASVPPLVELLGEKD